MSDQRYDGLSGLASVAEEAGEDERVVIALSLEPVSSGERASLTRHLLYRAGQEDHGFPDDGDDSRAVSVNVERRLDRQGLWAKLGAHEPMFRLQVLVRVESPNLGRAKTLIRNAYSAFEVWNGQNYFRAAGVPILRSFFLGSDLPPVRRLFDLKMAGLMLPLRRPVVTMGEIRSWLRPWLLHCQARVLRQGVLRRPPADAPTRGLVLCESFEGRPVALTPLDARHHVKVVGPTGSGKTALLANLALDNINAGRATVVIDPAKGDLIDRLLERIDRRHWDRVVLMAPWMDRTVGINLLESPHPAMHDLVTDQLVGIFHRLYEQQWGPRTEHVLRTAVLTLLRQPEATLCDIPYLLLSAEARRRFITGLDDPISLEPFWHEYELMGAAERMRVIGPLMYKLHSVLLQGATRDMLGQKRSTVDLGKLLDSGGILLVSLPKGELGEETSRLLGSLLVARLWQVAQARVRLREDARADALLILDEFRNLMNLPQTWDEIAVEARAYRWGLVLAHHHPAQLPTSMQRTFDANVRTKVIFHAEDRDAATTLARDLEPYLTASSLMRLEQYQVAVRAMLNGRPEPPFTGFTRPPGASFGDVHRLELVKRSLERWGRSRAEVEAELRARYSGRGWDIQRDLEELA